jgi:hypothetical protein
MSCTIDITTSCHDIISRYLTYTDAAVKLDSLAPKIVQATKEALLDPKNAAKQKALDDLLADAKKTSDFVTDAAERMRTDPSLSE